MINLSTDFFENRTIYFRWGRTHSAALNTESFQPLARFKVPTPPLRMVDIIVGAHVHHAYDAAATNAWTICCSTQNNRYQRKSVEHLETFATTRCASECMASLWFLPPIIANDLLFYTLFAQTQTAWCMIQSTMILHIGYYNNNCIVYWQLLKRPIYLGLLEMEATSNYVISTALRDLSSLGF